MLLVTHLILLSLVGLDLEGLWAHWWTTSTFGISSLTLSRRQTCQTALRVCNKCLPRRGFALNGTVRFYDWDQVYEWRGVLGGRGVTPPAREVRDRASERCDDVEARSRDGSEVEARSSRDGEIEGTSRATSGDARGSVGDRDASASDVTVGAHAGAYAHTSVTPVARE